jgi:hypothetical protein
MVELLAILWAAVIGLMTLVNQPAPATQPGFPPATGSGQPLGACPEASIPPTVLDRLV